VQISRAGGTDAGDRALAWPRAALIALLAWLTWGFVAHPLNQSAIGGSFMHAIDLVFHEAGHVIFAPFGAFMTALGGSLMQIVVPVVCAVAFVRKQDLFGAAVAVWWMGQNLVDLGPYIADARALQIVLLGGATGAEVEGHDWEAILTALGWLHRDRQLGMAAHGVGSSVMIASLAAATWIAWPRGRTGVGPGSDRGQTGVRPGSDQGRTGVRPGSDRGQTRVGPGSDQGRTPVRPRYDPRCPRAGSWGAGTGQGRGARAGTRQRNFM
jgi:hypothetical protein